MPPSSRKRTAQAVLSASLKQQQHVDAAAVHSSAPAAFSLHSNQNSDTELFRTWRTHTSLDFHAFFDPEEVIQIRQALLSWYHQHRRKLPWRGDPPPWTGTTVDFIANSSKKTTNSNGTSGSKKKKQKQTSLTSFFDSSKSATKLTTTPESSASNDTAINNTSVTAFPVTPYGVWVSEIMLQQTRVEAVIPYWVQWMQSFPTLFDLAAATPEQVNAHWAGLGFYRRARFLHAGAQTVVAQYASSEDPTSIIEWPTTVEAWQQLPGVGRYTASAICSICFQQNVPVVDGNVCRVLSRLRGVAQHVKAPVFKDQYAWTLLQPLLENTVEPGNVNQALMELGATYCAPSGTGIEEGDPLRDFYWSTRLVQPALEWNGGLDIAPSVISSSLSSTIQKASTTNCPLCAADGVEQVIQQWHECQVIPNMRVFGHQYLPMTPPQSAKRVQVWQVAALVRNNDDNDPNNSKRWLLVQRPPTGLLAGQWEFPCICLWDSADEITTTAKTSVKSVQKAVDPEPPTIPVAHKRNAWKTLMKILSADTVSSVQKVGSTPLEHVFSHVKHIMWLQTGQVEGEEDDELLLTTTDGRAMRWMNADDMKQVGITSGVKKILQAMDKDTLINTR